MAGSSFILGSLLSQTFINCTYRQFEMETLRSFQAYMKRCGTTGSKIVGQYRVQSHLLKELLSIVQTEIDKSTQCSVVNSKITIFMWFSNWIHL